MGQITIYLDETTVRRVRASAAAERARVSAWIAAVIHERLAGQWPAGIRALAGAWKKLPDADEIRRSGGKDLPRERF